MQALGLLVEVHGRRFAHRAPAVLRLVLGVLRGHEAAAAAAEDEEERQAEQRWDSGVEAGDRDEDGGGHVEAQTSIAVARGWQEAYAALVLFEKIGQQVNACSCSTCRVVGPLRVADTAKSDLNMWSTALTLRYQSLHWAKCFRATERDVIHGVRCNLP